MASLASVLLKRFVYVSDRSRLPSSLVPGYLYFVGDEGVILARFSEWGPVETFARQGPPGPQGPAGSGAWVPPAPPISNPQPPSGGGGFPTGTVLQFNGLPWTPPEGTWKIDVTCTLVLSSDHPLITTVFHNVKYQKALTGGSPLTLKGLIEGADSTYRMSRGKNGTLPKEYLFSRLGTLSVRFEITEWQESGEGENGPRYTHVATPAPGNATRTA